MIQYELRQPGVKAIMYGTKERREEIIEPVKNIEKPAIIVIPIKKILREI